MKLKGRTVIVGDELGKIHGVDISQSKVLFQVQVPKSERVSVDNLVVANDDGVVIASTSDGRLHRLTEFSDVETIMQSENGTYVGLERIEDGKILMCSDTGRISSLRATETRDTVVMNVGDRVASFRVSGSEKVVAVAGKEHELELWDLAEQKSIFKARNVKHDRLNLRVPVENTCLSFGSKENENLVCVGTGLGRLRIYDTRSQQRRPVRDIDTNQNKRNGMSSAIVDLDVASDGNTVMVGDNEGGLHGYDVGSGKMRGTSRGHSGGITSARCHSTEPAVASCGNSRFLLVHNVDTRLDISKTYLRNRLVSLAFVPDSMVQNVDPLEEDRSGRPERLSNDENDPEAADDEEDDEDEAGDDGQDHEEEADDFEEEFSADEEAQGGQGENDDEDDGDEDEEDEEQGFTAEAEGDENSGEAESGEDEKAVEVEPPSSSRAKRRRRG